jgi:hypothetical protein
MNISRRVGLALVAVTALCTWFASTASADSRQIPFGGTGTAQTGGFTPSAGDVTQDEFPTLRARRMNRGALDVGARSGIRARA